MSGTGASGLGESQLAGGGVVIENFGVAPPLDGGFQLAAGFFLAKMLVEQVAEKFFVQRAVGFGFQRLFHLAEQRNVGESGFSKNRFALLNVSLRERLALRGNRHVAFLDAQKTQQRGGVNAGQQVVDFKTQFVRKAMQVSAASVVGQDFQQAGQAAGARVGKHHDLRAHFFSRAEGFQRSRRILVIRPRQNAIDGVDEVDEVGGLSVSRMGHIHFKIGVNVRGIAAQNDNAVGEDDRFFDVVSDDENGARRNFAVQPEFRQFAAKRLRGEDVERGERLVHEEHFGLDDKSAGHTHALFHAAGEFLGVGGFKSVEPDGVNDAQRALVAFDGRRAARLERGFDIFENSEPGKKREALKDNGNVGRFVAYWLAVPVNVARAGGRKTRQHSK